MICPQSLYIYTPQLFATFKYSFVCCFVFLFFRRERIYPRAFFFLNASRRRPYIPSLTMIVITRERYIHHFITLSLSLVVDDDDEQPITGFASKLHNADIIGVVKKRKKDSFLWHSSHLRETGTKNSCYCGRQKTKKKIQKMFFFFLFLWSL